jgi:hypothetical protein
MSSCWYERATPRSCALPGSAPHSYAPRGQWSLASPGSAHRIAVSGALGCRPRARFTASRSAARRCLRGCLRPGRSSRTGGIDEFPLLPDKARSSRATRASSSAIRTSRAAHPSQPGAGGGISDTSHDHPELTRSKQGNTPGRRQRPPDDQPPRQLRSVSSALSGWRGDECLPQDVSVSVPLLYRFWLRRGLKDALVRMCYRR